MADVELVTAGSLINKLVEIGNMDAPVYIDGVGYLAEVTTDLGQEIILIGKDIEGIDE